MNKYKKHQEDAIRRSNSIKLIQLKFNKPIDELLKEDYMTNQMSIREMAIKYDVMPKTVHRWLVIFEVPRRTIQI